MASATRKTSGVVPTAADVPVTNAMLGKVRTEVLQRIDQAREEAKADIQRLDGKIDAVHAKLDGKIDAVHAKLDGKIDAVHAKLDAKIDAVKAELKAEIQEVRADLQAVKADLQEVKADLHEVKAGMHGMQAQLARMEVLMEAQDARNKIVLDGLTAVLSRQNPLEERVTRVEDTVRSLVIARPIGKPE